jgi:hypothetical protein
MAHMPFSFGDVSSYKIDDQPKFRSISMTEITTVKFDGVYVTLIAVDGSTVASAMAVSGVKGYQTPISALL